MSDADAFEECTECGRTTCAPTCKRQENSVSVKLLKRNEELSKRVAEITRERDEWMARFRDLKEMYKPGLEQHEILETAKKIPVQRALEMRGKLSIGDQILTSLRGDLGDYLPEKLRARLMVATDALWDVRNILARAGG